MDEEKKEEAVGEATANAEAASEPVKEGEGEKDSEPARTKPAAEKKPLLDPRTGEPLRDQTVPAQDTGYLGKHDMQDKTEKDGLPEGPSEEDFGDDEKSE